MLIAAQLRDLKITRDGVLGRDTGAAFAGTAALLFTVSAAVTARWCSSMATMGGMSMPGGWTMSMAWMRMPGQTWSAAAASFTAMWLLMMVTMMLPSLAPMLWRYREAVARKRAARPDRLAALAGFGYFFVWTAIGTVIFSLGALLAAVEMEQPALARAVPIAVGVVVLLAGVFQFGGWKIYHWAPRKGAECPGAPADDPAAAWRFGLRLGLHCSRDSAGLTAILLVMGVMDLRAMVAVTAAITAERLTPNGPRVARAVGIVAAGAGLYLIARAAGLG